MHSRKRYILRMDIMLKNHQLTSFEISIGISTTQLLHNLSTAIQFQAGDELILSKLNHEANTAPWVRIAGILGLTVKWWSSPDPKNPTCDVTELKSLLSDRTRLVACPHASNITGTISPIREIADAIHTQPRVSISSRLDLCSHKLTLHRRFSASMG